MNLNLIVALAGSLSVLFNGVISFMTLYRAFYYGSIVLFAVFSIYELYRRHIINRSVFGVAALSLSVMLISLLLLPDFSASISGALPAFCFFIALSIPMLILSSRITHWEELATLSRPYIMLSLVFSILVFVLPTNESMEYNMISGALIIPTISAMVCYFIRSDKLAGCIFVVNTITIFLRGSRAPLLGIIGGFLVVFLYSTKRLSVKRCVLYLTGFLMFVVAVIFRTQIVGFLASQFPDSRTIYLLANISNKQLFQTGRAEIQQSVMSLISQKTFTGYGPFGASYFLSRELGLPALQQGVYAHNLFLDLILQYGCIIGGRVKIT